MTTRRGSAEVEVRFVDRFTREVRQAARGAEDELKRSRQRNRRAAEDSAKDQPYQDKNGRWRDGKGRYLGGGGGGGGGGKGGGWDSRHGARDMMDFGERVADAVRAPIDVYSSFEAQMDSVAAATFDMTQAMDAEKTREMTAAVDELSKTARTLGADTKFSASQAAEGMDILAKNFSGEDIQKAEDVMAAMPGILDTAAATKESIADAADVSSSAMNQFGLAAKDMGMIGDVLVKTANSSATGLIDLGEALKYSGVTAHKAGVDLATTTAMLGALGNAGKKGSVAGTGLASVLGNIQSGAKKQKSALAALGIDITDKKGNLKPVVDLLADMQKAADKKFGEGKGGVRRDRWLQGLVGMGGDKEALAILMQQAGSGELQKLVQMNLEAEGTAKSVAAAMSDNAAGAAQELSGAYEELQLTIGEVLIPRRRT
jgi:TP901 family phage tail tape measure protein